MVNIWSLKNHKVFVAATQLYHYNTKAAIDNILQIWMWLWSDKSFFIETGTGLVLTPWVIVCQTLTR